MNCAMRSIARHSSIASGRLPWRWMRWTAWRTASAPAPKTARCTSPAEPARPIRLASNGTVNGHSIHTDDGDRLGQNVRRDTMASEVTLDAARRVIAAAEKKAKEIGQPMNIAVADEGGNLIAHVRMDGAWIGSVDISIKKAYTSRAFDSSTKDLAKHSQSGGQFF